MSSDAKSSGKSSWAKKLGIAAGILAVLLIATYLVATSSWMLKSVILPKASTALNASITVEDAAIHPFSGIALNGLKVSTPGAGALLSAKEAAVKYPSLFDLIGGKINIDDITISGVEVNIVQNPDGTSNLDVFTKASSAPSQPAAAGPVPQVRVKRLALADAGVHFQKTDKSGIKTAADLTGINVILENLGNDQTAKLSLKSGLAFVQATNQLQGAVKGDFTVALNGQLAPAAVAGTLETQIGQAVGLFKEVAGVGTTLKCDWTPAAIKDISLKLQRGNQGLAAVAVSGPLNLEKLEGKLKGDITAIDRQVLNLVGAVFGIDFNSTTINSSGEVEISQGGKQLALHGSVSAARFSVTQLGQTTPEMDVEAKYDLAVNLPAQTAMIQTFNLSGVQKRQEIIKGTLARPMAIAWGNTNSAVDESAFDLSIRGLNLADWRAFAQGTEPAGKLDLQLNLVSRGAGKNLAVDLNATLTDFAARFGSNRVADADLTLTLKSAVSNFAVADITAFEVRASHQKQVAATITGSGRVDSATMDADLKAGLEVSLPRMAALAGVAGMQFSSGSLAFQGAITQKNLNRAQTNQPPFDRSVVGQLRLSSLTGEVASNRFDRLAVTADCDLQVRSNLATIRKLAADLSQSGLAGGKAEVSGWYDLGRTNGQFAVKLTDLNENLLKSFAGALAPNKLERASISATLNAKYNPAGESGAQGEVKVENLLVTDPAGLYPKVPLTAVAKLDAGLQGQKAEIRQLNLAVQQGQADGGVVDARGVYDLARTNGQFTLNVTNLNQNALRPILAPYLEGKSLETVAINASLVCKADLAAESSVNGKLTVANLVIKDPKGEFPADPLMVQLFVDGSWAKQNLDLRAFGLQLTPTALATNRITLAGKINLANPKAITGGLKLTADALDITPYYNLFAGGPAGQTKPAAAPVAEVKPNVEPAAITNIPLANFTVDAAIGRFYLRDLAITNLATSVKIEGAKVAISNLQASINGAPVRGAVQANLGVPGYTYDASLSVSRLPLTPIASSFMPYAKDGLNGYLSSSLAIKGMGTTGRSLRQNLAGSVTMEVTNASIIVTKLLDPSKNKPSILSAFVKPLKVILTLTGPILGFPNMEVEAFQVAELNIQMGGGNIELKKFNINNPNLIVQSSGVIPIADVLNDSPLDLPVEISVSRQFGAKFFAPSTPATATHVKLPTFVKVKGTIGESDVKINKLALGGAVAETIGSKVGDDAGKILKGIGIFTGGSTTAVTNAPTAPAGTNQAPAPAPQPATNAVENLLNNLLRPRPKK